MKIDLEIHQQMLYKNKNYKKTIILKMNLLPKYNLNLLNKKNINKNLQNKVLFTNNNKTQLPNLKF